jgi:alpha-amylase/alpha-mannosidase (GH57 family)
VTSLIIHGHFYQPPRENPWTGAIDGEDSARPFHDWNERIHAECYRPNGFARVVNSDGLVERIVNNYANLSFNFGPTLMSWLEGVHPETYARVLEADRVSFRRHNSHGGAIAQAYNHAILPLCNERDRRTQVRWGIADFRHRFGRAPEALWLPETACNDGTMADLIEAGMKFVILSPHQAERTRPPEGGEWSTVTDGGIDPRKPYRYFHRDGSGRSIAVFFYDDGVSRGIAFENLLWSSEALVERLLRAAGGAPMVNIATDGESYGHHFKFGDRCLAYALEHVAPARGIVVTNYGELLEQNPPTDEVEIKAGPNGEGTAWSCSHGVGRWYRNCGCHTGGQPGWNQEWRGPLRAAYDVLRDRCADRFVDMGGALLRNPWAARDDYIEVLLSRGAARDGFLDRHARRRLSDGERLRAMNLFEMQRHAMLMYTSCGWFFTELSGIETVQTMKYAARTLDLMETLGGGTPLESMLEVLAQARSNIPEMGNGADVFRRFIPQSRVTPKRIGAHMAISTLANQVGREGDIGDYHFQQEDFRQERHGRLLLATSRLVLTELLAGRRYTFDSAALHLGGVDFYCALKDSGDPDRFREACAKVWARFRTASLPAMIRMVQEEFGPEEFDLEDVLSDGRRAICEMIFGDVLEGLTDQFARLYEEYHRVMEMLQESGFEPPPQFRQLTEFTLGRRFEQEIVKQQRSRDPRAYQHAAEIAAVVAKRGYQIDKSAANESFAAMVNDAVARAVERPTRLSIKAATELIELSRRLGLEPNLDAAQEHVYDAFAHDRPHAGQLTRLAAALELSQSALRRLRPHRPRAGDEAGTPDGRGEARPEAHARRPRSTEPPHRAG